MYIFLSRETNREHWNQVRTLPYFQTGLFLLNLFRYHLKETCKTDSYVTLLCLYSTRKGIWHIKSHKILQSGISSWQRRGARVLTLLLSMKCFTSIKTIMNQAGRLYRQKVWQELLQQTTLNTPKMIYAYNTTLRGMPIHNKRALEECNYLPWK